MYKKKKKNYFFLRKSHIFLNNYQSLSKMDSVIRKAIQK